MRNGSFAVVALLGLLMLAGCGGGTTAPTGTRGPTGTTAPAGTTAPGGTTAAAGCNDAGGGQAVSVVDFAYEPATLEVSVGDTVTWTNNGEQDHTVTFDDVDCGEIESGGSVSRTFDTAGTFDYVCTFHPNMTASVTVGQ